MSAETLRKAARLMRERAEATTPDADWTEGHYWIADYDMYGNPVQTEIGGMGGAGDAAHYSSWHPAVALAVADWLDLMAADYAPYWAEPYAAPFVPVIEKAYQIARTYLGESS